MLYRFRSVERLLDDRELEDNYFYFSSPSQQNDPLEGYVDFYWKGDRIAWLGLFKHYTWQLFMTMYKSLLTHDIKKLKELCLWKSEALFKGIPLLDIRKELQNEFIEDVFIQKLAEELEKCDQEISASQLEYILFLIHRKVLKYTNEKIYEKFEVKIIEFELDNEQRRNNMESLVLNYIENISTEPDASIVAEIIDNTISSLNMMMLSSFKDAPDYESKKIYLLLFSEFPQVYARGISWLSFPDWYCVCFSDNISNPALWGYYADSHKGVCLKFKNEKGGSFDLQAINKAEWRKNEKYKMEIKEVCYGGSPVRVEFFSSLGGISGDERKHWLCYKGEWSNNCEVFSDEEKWLANHLRSNEERFLRKSKAWEEEREYRIVLDDFWYIHSQNEQRLFRYDFNDLEGIIFGIKTPLEEKLKIIEIVKEKCIETKREPVTFYQAVYDAEKNLINYRPIPFLNKEFKGMMQKKSTPMTK